MPDDELDQRLRRLLRTRAETVNPHLDGPALRAASPTSKRVSHIAAPLLLAAVIVLLALTPTLLSRGTSHGHRQQPGNSVSVSVTPPSTPPPTPSPSTSPTPTTPGIPVVQSSPTIVLPTGPAVPGTSTAPLSPHATSGAPRSAPTDLPSASTSHT
jgi:hypothetical protein